MVIINHLDLTTKYNDVHGFLCVCVCVCMCMCVCVLLCFWSFQQNLPGEHSQENTLLASLVHIWLNMSARAGSLKF